MCFGTRRGSKWDTFCLFFDFSVFRFWTGVCFGVYFGTRRGFVFCMGVV